MRKILNLFIGILLCAECILFVAGYFEYYTSPIPSWQLTDIITFVSLFILCCLLTYLINKKSKNDLFYYEQSYQRIRFLLKLFLAFTFFEYGFGKLLGNQFYILRFRYDLTAREMAAGDIAWLFFGYSTAYKYFIGYSQIIASILILFRKTTFLGLLLFLTIIINIVFINYTFDIQLKFASTFYLIINLYLLFDYFNALKNTFFAKNSEAFIFNKFTIVKVFLIASIIVYSLWDNYKEANDTRKTNLYGSYNVDSLIVQANIANTLQDSSFRFTKLYFDISMPGNIQHPASLVNIKALSGKIYWEKSFLVVPDSISIEGKVFDFKGIYTKPDSSKLHLKGISKNKEVEIYLTKMK